ncbi:Erythromycin esterase homolog [Nocardiopsis flavescens]|uniref:Erythromycin esterase homolog n=1 Tax=Nocardiopsis flavescens TaxID=758803 RepID=A0A1M6JDY7_9ACTN|nr:erythromycin esterase family protein [Nocardiopsis flavescens]SHJ44921.1 Erythromycin esterase homolog [Nocardiopsis flavescens]
MSLDITDLAAPPCEILALGEPAHGEPAFPLIRNELFARLAERGFRSIALETDRVAALAADRFVRDEDTGTRLDTVMREGFSHGFGEHAATRQLVLWMREYNLRRPPGERLALHGFDAPTEMVSAPSPRPYLEHARDLLGLDLDIASTAGDDERWSRTEAVLDPAASVGATPEALRLRVIADDLLAELYARAPEVIAATSHATWSAARIHLRAGLDLLRYHRSAAEALEAGARTSRMLGARDAAMARNLLDIRAAEHHRGPTLVYAHNRHLQRHPSRWTLAGMDLAWSGAGSLVHALAGGRYSFVAGSLGRSAALALAAPEPGTHEGLLDGRVAVWGLAEADTAPAARVRTDPVPEQGYFPLDAQTLAAADAVLHVADGAAAADAL